MSRASHRPRRRSKCALLSRLACVALALFLPHAAASASESLGEQLLLKPLADGRVLASFEFTLTSASAGTGSYGLMPRALMQPLDHFGVSELQLALNSGRWRYASWGSPVTTLRRRGSYENTPPGRMSVGEESVASGAELVARFEDEPTPEQWKGLTSALAGLFCASLALDDRHTTRPQWAYRQEDGRRTLHAMLPTEGVCTENLTPFIKLLPCKNAAGVASLLNPLALFSAPFHGLAVHAARKELGWEVKLTVTTVFAPAVTRDISVRDWSLQSLFGRSLEKACPLADSAVVRVLAPPKTDGAVAHVVAPLPEWPTCSAPGEKRAREHARLFPVLDDEDEVTDGLAASGLLAFETDEQRNAYRDRLRTRWAHYLAHTDGEYIYDVSTLTRASSECRRAADSQGSLDIRMAWPNEQRFAYPLNTTSPLLTADRTLVGHDQQRGRLQVVLTNADTVPQRVVWFEALGSFVVPYLHTRTHSTRFLPDQGEDELMRGIQDFADPVEQLSYQPRSRDSAFVLESILRIPPRSVVKISFEVAKAFVPYSQHPPDAHRGFDLAPAIFFPLAPTDPRARVGALQKYTGAKVVPKTKGRIYTLPKLVELATPDFSFVYTNIIFTSTVVALFFGSTLNTLLRTYTDFVL
ncbi:GPI transamidase complex, GPI16/PIG-T component [Moesziomyces antarcticus T-34]|uniref:GPI transamidase complex, GPI16/PIG-T component n=1 Tax=Pseudozyma antarctica (strain T-34) TaxID=1151754 RepID=M9LK11_PSEA3|nr:GPI transamidase complex, GPI16/PIG-T component [Moesziomyces antarcticus T-34]